MQRRTASSGAPTGPIPTSASTCRTTATSSISSRAWRRSPSCNARSWWTIPPGCTASRGLVMSYPALTFIGFGEAGQTLAAGFRAEGVTTIAAWDILFPDAHGGPRLRAAAERIGVRVGRDSADAVRGADIVFSAVTAASNLEAANQAAPGLSAGQFYVELNSVSPNRKREAGAIVGSRVRFIGMAVMAPVHPLRHKTPVLISGPAAKDLLLLLKRCGMEVEEVGADVGAAAAIKMVRSVMVKGLAALTQECFIAARRAGVEERIIAPLPQSPPTV